ncbi:hypothetical protein CEV34_4771 [Brucella pseudogrignonensis]|uniref:Uncharacterized protein n=1 Tax=Brucella pseudogrignonensis TaxID=419475 RepID=A0A256G4V2_9HYPH|nr:hypothetical protein CEV34_4771 [Brucella pseudogrignonensis]
MNRRWMGLARWVDAIWQLCFLTQSCFKKSGASAINLRD